MLLAILILLNTTAPIDDNITTVDTSPMAFPDLMPQAAVDIVHKMQDVVGQDDDWRAGIQAWLGNDTNLTNSTGLFYA
jgi:hypothetical protein